MNLLKNAELTQVINAVAAGTSDTTSGTILDMSGYDSVMFILSLGDVTNTAVVTLQAQQNTANSASGMATLATATASVTADATSADNKLLVIDIHRPTERYIRAQVVRATANAVIDCVIAIQYNAMSAPITQGATVVASAFGASPAEA